ncbi:MAG TPA: HAMP domain-containing sensor histidine kinase [Tepidisphaeraceae bacterium]|jgi:signal transduction histidine kinase|nr:HAMP domain-containing sensor histidine kinase [Tepidisphaeraceae bacterium]
MTLKRKLLLRDAAMLLCLVLLSAASLWGMWGLNRTVALAEYEFAQLQKIASAEVAVTTAKDLVRSSDISGARGQIELARVALNGFLSPDAPQTGVNYSKEIRSATASVARLKTVDEQLKIDPTQTASVLPLFDETNQSLHSIVKACHWYIQDAHQAAGQRAQLLSIGVAILATVGMIVAVLMSIAMHRAVMHPLEKMREGTRRVAGGNFTEKVTSNGDVEFAELANDFNLMAGELAEFYRQLESKVAQKSKELVRSERLASVGFLAAGVAHEINNPLNIISGYAELTLKQLAKIPGPEAREAHDALRVIRDESFRCKDITQKLLSLARSGSTSHRENFSLAHVAEEVTSVIRGLSTYKDRRVEVGIDRAEPLIVYGSVSEIKQVLVNLMVNALEAVRPSEGQVKLEGRRSNGWVELSVIDNGRGMSPEVIEHVFEPFFTAKRGAGEPGTGLGLSITHAIVENHGGQVIAQSDGIGKGSKFTVRLPAKKEER